MFLEVKLTLTAKLESTSGLGLELDGIQGGEEEVGIGVEMKSVSVTQDDDEGAGDTTSTGTTQEEGIAEAGC